MIKALDYIFFTKSLNIFFILNRVEMIKKYSLSPNMCFGDISSPRLSRLRFEPFPNYTGDEKSSFMKELYICFQTIWNTKKT